MAATNGYRARQSSDMYPTYGDEIDWLYGTQRIFSYTFEMYPTTADTSGTATTRRTSSSAGRRSATARRCSTSWSRPHCPYRVDRQGRVLLRTAV